MTTVPIPDIDRLLSHVVEHPNGCWIWTASINSTGYGMFSYKGKMQLAHRASYSIHFGDPAPGKQVHHRCGTRLCVNPLHLEETDVRTHRWLGRPIFGRKGPPHV